MDEQTTVYIMPVNERTCRNCGTDEQIIQRWIGRDGDPWVNLECGHTQWDGEY